MAMAMAMAMVMVMALKLTQTNIMKSLIFLSINFISLIFFSNVNTFTTISDGNYNSSSSWSFTGTDADGIPDNKDHVIINHNITLQGTSDANYMTINASGILNMNNHQLRLWLNNGTHTNDGVMNGSGTIRTITNHIISGTGNYNSVTFSNDYKLTFSCDLTLNNHYIPPNGSIEISPSATMNITGSFRCNSSSYYFTNLGTLVINDVSNFMQSNFASNQRFRSSSGNVQLPNGGSLPETQDGGYNTLTIAGTTISDFDFFVNGNFENTGNFSSSSGRTVSFSGSSQQDITGTNTFYNLTLNNSSGLRFVSGAHTIWTVLKSDNGNFSNIASTVTLASDSDGEAAQLDNLGSNTYSGNLIVERKLVASAEGYRMLSSPVQSTTLSEWQDDGILFSGFTGSNHPNSAWTNTYYYDQSQVAVGESADSGFVAVTNINHSTSNYPNLQNTIIYNSAGTNITLSVEGVPNQGNVTQNVSVGQVGWNLIANPYPCNLDWSSFRSSNSSIVGAGGQPYVWNATNGNYSTALSTISHSQGFFIDANSSGTLTFQESHKTTSSTSFIKSNNGINLPLELEITGDVNNYKDHAYVKALPNATNNFDIGYDQRKLLTMIPFYSPNIYFQLADSTKLSTNSINNSTSNDIMLYSKIGSYAPGNYTISFNNLNQFMVGSCITLEDMHNGIITDLRSDSSYTFQSDSLAPFPRFIIHIDIDYDINVHNPTCYSFNNGDIEISGVGIDNSYFKLIKDNLLIDSIYTLTDSLIFNNLISGVYNLETNHVGNCSLRSSDLILIDPIEVNSEFTVNFNTLYLDSNQTLLTLNQSSGASYYEWDFGDNNFSNDYSPIHNYNNAGQYFVTLLALNDSVGSCSDVSVELINIVNNSVNITFLDSKENKLFYDFYSQKLVLESSFTDYVIIELVDLSGRKYINKKFSPSNIISVDISNLPSGFYLTNIYTDKNFPVITRKILKN